MNKTVFVSGIFNVLHPGHMRLLRFAKECGERLVVAVESDRLAGAAAHLPKNLRIEGVQSLNTDEAITVLEGSGAYDFLDNSNKIRNSVPLAPYGEENSNSFYCRINRFTRHQIRVESDFLFFHICLNGPYDKRATVYV